MQEVLVTSSLLTLAFAMLALVLVLVVLRLFDMVTGTPFSETKKVIKNDPKAAATYYGLRFLGVCLLVGQLFS